MTRTCVRIDRLREVMRPGRNCFHAVLLSWEEIYGKPLDIEPWVQSLIRTSTHEVLAQLKPILQLHFEPLFVAQPYCLIVKNNVMLALMLDTLHVLRWTLNGVRLNSMPTVYEKYRMKRGN